MTREIKFRAWDDIGKVMTCWGDILKNQRRGFFVDLEVVLSGDWPHMLPMQFTGLKDKNGVEICEGDIVAYEMSNSKNGGKYIMINWVIRWCDEEACFEVFDSLIGNSFECDFLCNSEVIGNIHENPELLENNNP